MGGKDMCCLTQSNSTSSTPFPSIPQVAWPGKHHGEYISVDSKLLNCYLVVFIILLFVFYLFLNFICYFYIPNVQPSFSQCPGRASWTHWAGIPSPTTAMKHFSLSCS